MSDWSQVRAGALARPETTQRASYGGEPSWCVKNESFLWLWPLRKKDQSDLGDTAPRGPILGARVADLDQKDEVLAELPAAFTIPHFGGYPAVLVDLDRLSADQLKQLADPGRLSAAALR